MITVNNIIIHQVFFGILVISATVSTKVVLRRVIKWRLFVGVTVFDSKLIKYSHFETEYQWIMSIVWTNNICPAQSAFCVQRERERKYRSGEVAYADRHFKFSS